MFAAFLLLCHVTCSSHILCRLEDSSSLLQFKASFNIDIFFESAFNIDITDTNCGKLAYAEVSTWQNGTDCCSWLGVTCDTISGHINGLDLRLLLIFSFLNLSSLVTFSLKGTGLRGNMITNDNTLCLPKLQELYMSANFHLQGQLPKVSCSTSLNVLDLSVSIPQVNHTVFL
ncbi:receptor protein Cf-9 [Trifolium repens]|nr:receptor protein Cf-9 [Trifolium repens]